MKGNVENLIESLWNLFYIKKWFGWKVSKKGKKLLKVENVKISMKTSFLKILRNNVQIFELLYSDDLSNDSTLF